MDTIGRLVSCNPVTWTFVTLPSCPKQDGNQTSESTDGESGDSFSAQKISGFWAFSNFLGSVDSVENN